MSAIEQWPPIRQADGMPIVGGWSVSYEAEDLSSPFNARGSTPVGVLQLIVSHRLANDLPANPDEVKAFLENQWYRRDSRRFTRRPTQPITPEEAAQVAAQPECGVDALFSATVGMVNAAAAAGNKHSLISAMQAFQALLKDGRFRCERCDIFLEAFMKQNRLEHLKTPSLVRDWAYDFQSQFAKHLNRPIKPREVVEAQWCWPSTK